MQSTHYSCQILMKLESSRQIFEKYSNFMKIHPVGSQFFYEDRWADMTKLIVAFQNSANATKKCM